MKLAIDIVFFFALLTPALPKIGIANGIYVSILEIFLIAFFPLLVKQIRFKLQRILLYFWLACTLSTLFACILDIFDASAIMRCFKGIIYIPLFAIAYDKFKNEKNAEVFILPFILASMANFLTLVYFGFNFSAINIWSPELIGSGLSNRCFDLQTMQYTNTATGGSHGIWTGYNCLVFAVILSLHLDKRLNLIKTGFLSLLVLFNVACSVSREGFLVLIVVMLGFFSLAVKLNSKPKVKPSILFIAIISVFSIAFIVAQFGDMLLLVSKLQYTMESVDSKGSEGNAALRFGAWIAIAVLLLDNPIRIFSGFGYSFENLKNNMNYINLSIPFVKIPESYFVLSLVFGGIFGLIFAIMFWKEIFSICIGINNSRYFKRLILSFFFGLLIVNTISGASILADSLYATVLLVLGYAKKRQTC